ncbi:MAG: ATP-binding cassette domain-containing protein, partial [Oscillospiraceae bacterium]
MSDTWKEKLYEPSDEPIAVQNVNFSGEEPKADGDELITIEGVDLDYSGNSGKIKALENINFNIFPGEFICVLGPSGCGKSTLLKILAGFIQPT